MKKSLTLMVVALIIFGVIYTPFLTDEVNKRSSIEGGIIRGENKSGNFEYRTKLTNQGVFSLRGLKNLTLRPSNGQHDTLINVTLIQTQGNQKESEVLEGNDIATFEFDLEDFREWVLQIHSEEPFALEYEKKMELQEKKIDAFSIIAFFYVGVFLEWPAILYPIRQKYTGKGIYR